MPIDTLPPLPEATPSGETATQKDRRRPGRIPITNPDLIALLRAPVPDTPLPDPPEVVLPAQADDLAPMRGIIVSAALGALLWCLAIGAIVLAAQAYGSL